MQRFSKESRNHMVDAQDMSDLEDDPFEEEEDGDAMHEDIIGQETSAMDTGFDFGEPVAGGDQTHDDDNVEY